MKRNNQLTFLYFCSFAKKKKISKKDDTLKIYGILDDDLKLAVQGNPKPRKTVKKKK